VGLRIAYLERRESTSEPRRGGRESQSKGEIKRGSKRIDSSLTRSVEETGDDT